MKLKDIKAELDKYDDDFELTIGDKSLFVFTAHEDDKILNMVPIG